MKQLKIVINFKNLQKDTFSKEDNILNEHVVEKKITPEDPPIKDIKEKIIDPKPSSQKKFSKLDSLGKKKK